MWSQPKTGNSAANDANWKLQSRLFVYTTRDNLPGRRPASRPKKYIIAIIVVGIIGLVAGGLISEAFFVPPDVTDVTGTVTLNTLDANTYRGTVSQILFGGADTGNLSSTVFQDHSYQAYLPIGDTYTVVIQWTNITSSSTATYSCTASPGTFSSLDPNATQNFSC